MDTRNAFPLRLWHRVRSGFAAWQVSANARTELASLTDQTLCDIGLSRGFERLRPAQPFWIP
jgi:uncharacterized protein YjiS (DUF1127 family)